MRFLNRVPKKGFTLLETLVSLFLLVLILMALATWGMDSAKLLVRQNRNRDANLRVMQALERLNNEVAFGKLLQVSAGSIQIEDVRDHQKITWDIGSGRIRRVSGSTAYFTLPEDPPQTLNFIKLTPNLIQVNDRLVCVRNP